jgi:predicted glutamine amidotransferase
MHAGRTPLPATFWLIEASDSLAAQSHANPDGAGIGCFGRHGAPTLDKEPLAAWQDTEFATAARTLIGTTFVAHVRYASTGGLSVANTHPFLLDERLFAHNGVLQGLDLLAARLDELGVGDLIVATEKLDADGGWRAFDPGELVHVSADLAIDSRTPVPPPAHPLRLSDLTEAAAVSQQPAHGSR